MPALQRSPDWLKFYTLHGLILDVFEGLKPPGE